MQGENIVSAVILPQDKQAVTTKITEIRTLLSCLITMQPEEVQSLVKAGKGAMPFIDKTTQMMTEYPQIIPPVINVPEYKKDVQLAKDLEQIQSQLEQLMDAVNNTLYAARSDAMAVALDMYAVGKFNRDKVPGLNVLVEDMGAYFKKTRRLTPPAA